MKDEKISEFQYETNETFGEFKRRIIAAAEAQCQSKFDEERKFFIKSFNEAQAEYQAKIAAIIVDFEKFWRTSIDHSNGEIQVMYALQTLEKRMEHKWQSLKARILSDTPTDKIKVLESWGVPVDNTYVDTDKECNKPLREYMGEK